MAGEATQVLSGFAAELRHEDVPEHVRAYCKDLLLDALGCALAGYDSEETPQVARLAGSLAGSTEACVIGGSGSSLAGATLLNSYLITAVTMCDVHRATVTHVTPEVVPPALAIAERDDLPGRDLLVAVAAGCEVVARLGAGLDYEDFRRRGWHGAGVLGPFGAAAAAGRLLGLDVDAMARAMGLAGSQAAGTYAAFATPTVKFHQCRAALGGLMAALLAQQGFVATRTFLTAADGGLYSTYVKEGHLDTVTAGLGRHWELEQIALRLWPSVSMIQGMVTAMFDLVEQNDLRPDQVRKLRLSMSPRAYELYGGLAHYRTKFDAKLSIHYTAAVILHDRELALAQFEPERYDDPVLRRFASERVDVRPDSSLAGVQAIADAECVDGGTRSARCDFPRGAPENPLTHAQVESKFRTYARRRLPDATASRIVDAVAHLEQLRSVRDLAALLRSG